MKSPYDIRFHHSDRSTARLPVSKNKNMEEQTLYLKLVGKSRTTSSGLLSKDFYWNRCSCFLQFFFSSERWRRGRWRAVDFEVTPTAVAPIPQFQGWVTQRYSVRKTPLTTWNLILKLIFYKLETELLDFFSRRFLCKTKKGRRTQV